jgi:predicted transcriptional regulator
MKTAISVPDDVFRRADRAARRLGISRSELFTRAIREFLAAQDRARVKSSYDEAFADSPRGDELSRFRRAAARRVMGNVEW